MTSGIRFIPSSQLLITAQAFRLSYRLEAMVEAKVVKEMGEAKGVMGEPTGDIATQMYSFLGVTPECEVSGDRKFLKDFFEESPVVQKALWFVCLCEKEEKYDVVDESLQSNAALLALVKKTVLAVKDSVKTTLQLYPEVPLPKPLQADFQKYMRIWRSLPTEHSEKVIEAFDTAMEKYLEGVPVAARVPDKMTKIKEHFAFTQGGYDVLKRTAKMTSEFVPAVEASNEEQHRLCEKLISTGAVTDFGDFELHKITDYSKQRQVKFPFWDYNLDEVRKEFYYDVLREFLGEKKTGTQHEPLKTTQKSSMGVGSSVEKNMVSSVLDGMSVVSAGMSAEKKMVSGVVEGMSVLSGLLGTAEDKKKTEGAEEKLEIEASKAQSSVLGHEIRTVLHDIHDSPHDNNEVVAQLLGISVKAGAGPQCKGFITIGVKHSNAIVKLPWGATCEKLCSEPGTGLIGGWFTFKGLTPPSEKDHMDILACGLMHLDTLENFDLVQAPTQESVKLIPWPFKVIGTKVAQWAVVHVQGVVIEAYSSGGKRPAQIFVLQDSSGQSLRCLFEGSIPMIKEEQTAELLFMQVNKKFQNVNAAPFGVSSCKGSGIRLPKAKLRRVTWEE